MPRSVLTVTAVAAMTVAAACAAPVPQATQATESAGNALSAGNGLPRPQTIDVARAPTDSSGHRALEALSNGRWHLACGVAADVLAHKVPDTDALGVFGICSALGNERQAANTAIARLRDAEGAASYYGRLTQGVLDLIDKSPEKAQTQFRAVIQMRPNDPLAHYFDGEALHARQQSVAAIAAFERALKAWPNMTPALTAVAKVLSGPKATTEELAAAAKMTERAASLEPMNTSHWRLLADLSRRMGQHGRANAIELQHLRNWTPAAPTR